MKIDAKGVYYADLNKRIRDAIAAGAEEVELLNVNGQRYIGNGLNSATRIIVHGVPGNDLAAFMNGPTLIVHDNAQDGIANTMNQGKIVIYGHAGDVLGYGMRGGKLFIKGDVGYRVGIHMKSYKDKIPVIVAGGTAGDFFGEYMAGGILILLGLNADSQQPFIGSYVGTGMHGGVIYLRGEPQPHQLGAEVGVLPLEEEDEKRLHTILQEYSQDLGLDFAEIMSKPFIKLLPISHRPYGKLYAY